MKKIILFGLLYSLAVSAFSKSTDSLTVYILRDGWIKKIFIYNDTASFSMRDTITTFVEKKCIETKIAQVPDSILHHLKDININELGKMGHVRDLSSFTRFAHPWLSLFSTRKIVNEFRIKDKKIIVTLIDKGIDWWTILFCICGTFVIFLILSLGIHKYKFIILFLGTFATFAIALSVVGGFQINNQNDITNYLKSLVLPTIILFIATGLKWIRQVLEGVNSASI